MVSSVDVLHGMLVMKGDSDGCQKGVFWDLFKHVRVG